MKNKALNEEKRELKRQLDELMRKHASGTALGADNDHQMHTDELEILMPINDDPKNNQTIDSE